MAIRRDDFPLPDLDDELSAPFYRAAAAHELRIPRCESCGEFVWYPEPVCPHDGGTLTWERVSGNATLFSWAVVQRAFLPAFADKVPFVTALAALDEDSRVRIPTYVVDSDPASLTADAPLEVSFRELSFSTVPGRAMTVPMFHVRAQ